VSYKPGKGFEEGRVYARGSDSNGLQGMEGWIRRILSYRYMHDLDMANCAPTLLKQIFVKHLGPNGCPPLLRAYVEDREGAFARIKANHSDLFGHMDAATLKKTLKKMFLIGCHGGKHSTRDNLPDTLPRGTAPLPEFETWESELRTAVGLLGETPGKYAAWRKRIAAMPDKTNPLGTFCSWVWQEAENQILLELRRYFEQEAEVQWKVGVLVYDGLMVEKKADSSAPFPLAELRLAEQHVQTTLGWEIRLEEKPLTPTPEDWNKYYGPRSMNKMPKGPPGKILYAQHLLYTHAHKLKHRRMGDRVLAPHATIPGVYVDLMGHSDYINLLLSGQCGLLSHKPLEEWMATINHPRFPLLTGETARDIISFTDGYLHTSTLLFRTWAQVQAADEAPPLTQHFFEVEFGSVQAQRLKPTPLWDSFLGHQMVPEVQAFVEAMIGRMFYQIKTSDNWQICLMLKGDAGTGKGTFVNIVTAMFPELDVGTITASLEITFGLQALHTKRLVTVPDMPERFCKILDQQTFQSMVSGDDISVPCKHSEALPKIPWRAHTLIASNYWMDYNDPGGAISRRLAVVLWTKKAHKVDGTLENRIKRIELVALMVRCLFAYSAKRAAVLAAGGEIWDHMPAEMRAMRKQVATETSPLAAFLADGDGHYQIIFEQGTFTTREALSKAFSNHMKFVHKRHGVLGTDYHPIEVAGYTVKTLKMCKVCTEVCTKATCGDHYNPKNRKNVVGFENMKILTKCKVCYKTPCSCTKATGEEVLISTLAMLSS
jgi:phage/plasmid-associated DNA primase